MTANFHVLAPDVPKDVLDLVDALSVALCLSFRAVWRLLHSTN